MNKKAIIFGVVGIYLLLTAGAIYFLMDLLQLSFIMAFLTVISVFAVLMGIISFLFRNRLISGVVKLPKDKKGRFLNNYEKQCKLYKLILLLAPIYVFVFILIYKYGPDLKIETLANIIFIFAMFYLWVILKIINEKFRIKILKENLQKQTEPSN